MSADRTKDHWRLRALQGVLGNVGTLLTPATWDRILWGQYRAPRGPVCDVHRLDLVVPVVGDEGTKRVACRDCGEGFVVGWAK